MTKRTFFTIFAAAVALCLIPVSCRDKADQELAHHHHDHGHSHEHEHEEGHVHDHEHEHEHGEHEHEAEEHVAGEIVLQPAIAERLGVKAEKIEPGAFAPALAVSGRIEKSSESVSVATAPSAGTVTYAAGISPGSQVRKGQTIGRISTQNVAGGDANAAAKAAYEAAKRELDRLKPLYEQRLVTASEYNAAVSAYEQARAAYSSNASGNAITAPISGVITALNVATGGFVDAGAPVASVDADGKLLVLADVPVRHAARAAQACDARLATADGRSILLSEVGGKRLSASASAAAASGYIPVTFTLPNDGSLVAGQAVDVYLIGTNAIDALTVPKEAIVEQQGRYFVYEQLDDECYRKLPVTTGATDGSRVEITQGIEPGQTIVVAGAVAVRLAESASVAPEGHSHNH